MAQGVSTSKGGWLGPSVLLLLLLLSQVQTVQSWLGLNHTPCKCGSMGGLMVCSWVLGSSVDLARSVMQAHHVWLRPCCMMQQ
jgi:hypothetical protein